MPKIVFVCSHCGAKYVNDAVCQQCGKPNDASRVFDPAGNPVQSVRPALPSETDYFSTVSQEPDPYGSKSKGGKK